MKFLRQTSHVASMIVPFALLAGVAVFVAFAPSSQSNSNSSETQREQHNTDQPESQPLIDHRAQPSENQRDARELWPKFLDRLIDPVTWFTGGLVFLAFCQWRTYVAQTRLMRHSLRETRHAVKASQRSADAAVLAVEHADRPWLRVYLQPRTLTVSETEGIQITCAVIVKNEGKSVAEDVTIWNYLATDPQTVHVEQEKLRAHCDRALLVQHMGMTIFPDETKVQVHTVGTGKEAPENYWRKMMPDMLDMDLCDRILPLTYIGCVGYRYGTSNKWHYTYWGHDVVTADGRHLPLHIAAGKLPQPPFLREALWNLNRAT